MLGSYSTISLVSLFLTIRIPKSTNIFLLFIQFVKHHILSDSTQKERQ